MEGGGETEGAVSTGVQLGYSDVRIPAWYSNCYSQQLIPYLVMILNSLIAQMTDI